MAKLAEGKVRRTMYIDVDLFELAKDIAWSQRSSLNAFVVDALRKAVEQSQKASEAK